MKALKSFDVNENKIIVWNLTGTFNLDLKSMNHTTAQSKTIFCPLHSPSLHVLIFDIYRWQLEISGIPSASCQPLYMVTASQSMAELSTALLFFS